jgi:hypothetical protein
VVVAVVSVTLLASPSCTSLPAEPSVAALRTGIVSHTPEHLSEALTRLRLDHPGKPHPIDRTTLYVNQLTVIYVRDGAGRLTPGAVDDLEIGAPLRFWVTDVEFRSYPVQQYATRIEIDR